MMQYHSGGRYVTHTSRGTGNDWGTADASASLAMPHIYNPVGAAGSG